MSTSKISATTKITQEGSAMHNREKTTESFALQAIGWSIIIMGMLYILMQARLPVPRHEQPQHANPVPTHQSK